MRFDRWAPNLVVIAGLDSAIHSVTVASAAGGPEWMPGSSPGMTTGLKWPRRFPGRCHG